MFINGIDVTLPTAIICSAVQILLYIAFTAWAINNPNPDNARRWKASIIFGGLGTALLLLVITAPFVGIKAINQISEIDPRNTLSIFIAFSQVIFEGFVGFLCFAVPPIFIATISIYIGFLQTYDYWLDRLWKKAGNTLKN